MKYSRIMCPLWPLHILLLYILIVAPLLLMAHKVPTASLHGFPKKLNVMFSSEMNEKMVEGKSEMINFAMTNLEDFADASLLEVELTNTHPDVAEIVENNKGFFAMDFVPNSNWSGSFNLTARFLGYTKIAVKLWGEVVGPSGEKSVELVGQSEPKSVAVTRVQRPIDRAFVYTVAILVSIAFVNMGCTLDLDVVRETLKRPIGPVIGFCCQYIFMPMCAFGMAKLLLAHNAALQLGLFVTGCSPGGGASNMWTYVLGGNLHLSITMTCLSTLAAFAMMPLWTMTLGRLIFTDGQIVVPYQNIATLAIGLIIPLAIGLATRRYLPRVASVMVKCLKPVSGVILLTIIIFGVYANLFMFKLMDWKVLVAGMSLSWLGYAFGGITAILCRQTWSDAVAVAVETGVQNTGIAIFILRFTLDQPAADINTVVPVAVAIFTPIPLMCLWVLQKCVLNRCGVCLPVVDDEKGEPISDTESQSTQNGSASIEKLLPNNNVDTIPVVVKVLPFADY